MIHDRLQAMQNLQTCIKISKNADYVLLQFTDIQGILRGRTVPSEQTAESLAKGVAFDGSSLLGGVNIEESDMIMKPDPDTFTVYPYYFYDKSVAGFICNIQSPAGIQYENDSRHILQKTVRKALKEGYELTAAAELEFYIVQRGKAGQIIPVENHLVDKQRYFDNSPGRDTTEPYRMDLSHALSAMGISVERQHHEVGSAQNEITFKYSDPTTTADSVMRYKFAAKAVAEKKYNWTATFMPKPWHREPGSGMHVHLGAQDPKTGRNPFYDPEGYAHISQKCRYFIGGILAHARALSAVVAPSVNSYKRLVPGYEAPVYIAWSKRNRSALVRVPAFPADSSKEARIEFRCPDPVCNPYLAYATVFEAGLDGVRKKIEPPEPLDTNVYNLGDDERRKLGVKTLPVSLKEALDEWETDSVCVETLGKQLAYKYVQAKSQEWNEYKPHQPRDTTEVTRWEHEKYLHN